MKSFLLILFFYLVTTQFQIRLTDAMRKGYFGREGKARNRKGNLIEGSSQIYEQPLEFSLIEIYDLIQILEKIDFDNLVLYLTKDIKEIAIAAHTEDNEKIVKVIDYYHGMSDDFFENHSPLADKYERVCALLEFCDKYVEINRHNSLLEEWGLIRGMIDFGYSPDIITMDNAIAFVEGYKDKIDETFPDNLLVEKNMFIAMHLYAFARKLIRSFFEVHGIDHIQYYQNLVENCNRNVEGVPTKKLSIFQYLMARDRFEADANNLMFFTNKIPNLQYIENENIKPSADITKENRSCEFVNQYIYQYDDIEDYLTKHECNIIKKRMKQYKEGNAKYRPFYAYYKDFGPEIQRKMEKYIINPFLTHEGNREYAKTNYLGRNQKIRDNSLYLPQPHFELSKLINAYCTYLQKLLKEGSDVNQINMFVNIWMTNNAEAKSMAYGGQRGGYHEPGDYHGVSQSQSRGGRGRVSHTRDSSQYGQRSIDHQTQHQRESGYGEGSSGTSQHGKVQQFTNDTEYGSNAGEGYQRDYVWEEDGWQ